MKKTNTILTLMALSAATAFAGVEPAPVSSGKGTMAPPPPVDPCAVPISYNNVELLYANTDSGSYYNDSSDGIQLNVEISPWNNIYFAFGGSYTDEDHGSTWTLNGGIGGYLPLTDNIHLAADAGILYINSDTDSYLVPTPQGNGSGGGKMYDYYSYDDSDTGWYIRPHIRAKWSCFEVHAGVMYVDVDNIVDDFDNGDLDNSYNDEGDDWAFFVQAFYQVAPGWDVTAGYTTWDESDADTWTIGARYRF